MIPPRHLGPLVLMALFLTLYPPKAVAVETQGVLTVYHVEAEVLGRGVQALACRLRLPDGSWRGAVSSEALGWNDLITETGEGWSVIALADERCWWNRWRGPSRNLSPESAHLAVALASHLDDLAAPPRRVRGMAAVPDSAWTGVQAEETAFEAPSPVTGLKDRLMARGRGRGADEETLWLSWNRREDSGGGDALVIRSRRRPGAMRLEPVAEYRASFDAQEILLPIWPLVELMRVEDRP